MPSSVDTDPLETLLLGLESEIIAASERDLLDGEAHRRLGTQAHDVVAKALATRWPRPRPSAARSLGGDPGLGVRRIPRREIVQRLLVASAHARDLAGAETAHGLSDAEVESIFQAFAGAGLVPRRRSEGGTS